MPFPACASLSINRRGHYRTIPWYGIGVVFRSFAMRSFAFDIVFPPCVRAAAHFYSFLIHYFTCFCPDATAFRSCRAPYRPASGADGEPIPFAFRAIGIRSHSTAIRSSFIPAAKPTPTAPAPVTGHWVQGCSRSRLVEEIPGGTGRAAPAGPMARPRRRKS